LRPPDLNTPGKTAGASPKPKTFFSQMARIPPPYLITRRNFITGAAGLAVLRPRFSRAASNYPFTLGVASGCPRPDGVVLWTRLAPGPLSPDPNKPGGMTPDPVPVRWEIADDEQMQRVVQSGSVTAEQPTAHSVPVAVG